MEIQNILTGNEKIVVAQEKGGGGKTTVSTQLLVPFLYRHNGGKQVKYIEVNSATNSVKFFKESEIISSGKIKVNNKITVDNEDALSDLMTDEGNVVIDLGGNVTTGNVIKAIGCNMDFKEVFWFIPLGTGKGDAQGALSTYFKIQDIYSGYKEKPRIMFVLCGGMDEDVEMDFAFFFGSEWMDLDFVLKNDIPKEDFNYIIFKNLPKIILSTALRKLCVEIAEECKLKKELHEAAENMTFSIEALYSELKYFITPK